MEFGARDNEERLRRLSQNGWIPPHRVWLPYLVATLGIEPIAELGERADLAEGGSKLVLTALLPKRLVRVIGSGTGRWEDPSGRSGVPSEVLVESVSIDRADLTLQDFVTYPPDFGDDHTIEAEVLIRAGGKEIPVPYFSYRQRPTNSGRVDDFLKAMIIELNR